MDTIPKPQLRPLVSNCQVSLIYFAGFYQILRYMSNLNDNLLFYAEFDNATEVG